MNDAFALAGRASSLRHPPGCCPGLCAFALAGRGVEHRGAETRRCGDTEVWRYGGKYYVFEDTESFLELRDSVTLCLF